MRSELSKASAASTTYWVAGVTFPPCARPRPPAAHRRTRFSLDHLRTLWGKRLIGVLGGGGRSGQLIPALVQLYQQGRFPFDRLARYYAMNQIEQALADSASGDVIKPILRMPG